MDNHRILKTAMTQSAADLGCTPEDFLKTDNVVVLSQKNPDARKYLTLPFSCNLVSYGNNIVASVSPKFHSLAQQYINSFPVEHCFETPNLHVLNRALEPLGERICFMALYFLPDIQSLASLSCPYEIRLLSPKDFAGLYLPQWSNALCAKRKHLDCIAAGAYDHGRLIGLAGASADCESMWQIGIDVLPEYRRQGVASALTSRLALEILDRGIVPFYCAAWSNLKSVRNALRSGFRPAWTEMTAKPISQVEQMNQYIQL